MKQLILIISILFPFIGNSQIELWQLEWAPDTAWVIGALDGGEPTWVGYSEIQIDDSLIYVDADVDTLKLRAGGGEIPFYDNDLSQIYFHVAGLPEPGEQGEDLQVDFENYTFNYWDGAEWAFMFSLAKRYVAGFGLLENENSDTYYDKYVTFEADTSILATKDYVDSVAGGGGVDTTALHGDIEQYKVAFGADPDSLTHDDNFHFNPTTDALGLGTDTPIIPGAGTGLHINGGTFSGWHVTNPTTGALVNDGTAGFLVGSEFYIVNYETDELTFATQNIERMAIGSTGRVRIATLDTDSSAPSTSGTTKMVVTDGNAELSFANIPLDGLVTLNSQTGATQTFSPGTSGTDFNISSSSNVHTFNLPTVSGSNRGAVTSAMYNAWQAKLDQSASFGGDVSGTYSNIRGKYMQWNSDLGLDFNTFSNSKFTYRYGNVNTPTSNVYTAIECPLVGGTLNWQLTSRVTDNLLWFRNNNGGAGTWQEIFSTLNPPNALKYAADLSFDWNTNPANNQQAVRYAYANINSPDGNANDGIDVRRNNTYGWQIAKNGTSNLYVRGRATSTWGAWQEIITDNRLKTINGNSLVGSGNISVGTITGTGSTGYVPYFTSSTAVAASNVYFNSNGFGFGTTSPLFALHLNNKSIYLQGTSNIIDKNNSGGTANYVLTGTGGSGVDWEQITLTRSTSPGKDITVLGGATVLNALVPTNGTTGQVLTKTAGSYDWASPASGTVTSIATNNGITGGTITSTGTIGLTGNALSLHNLASTGIIARTAANTVTARTITANTAAGEFGLSVSNGDGVAGDPSLSLLSNFAQLLGNSDQNLTTTFTKYNFYIGSDGDDTGIVADYVNDEIDIVTSGLYKFEYSLNCKSNTSAHVVITRMQTVATGVSLGGPRSHYFSSTNEYSHNNAVGVFNMTAGNSVSLYIRTSSGTPNVNSCEVALFINRID